MKIFGMSAQMLVRAALCVVVFGAGMNGTAEAQWNGVQGRQTQAAGAPEGTFIWGQDDCTYVFQQGGWRATDLCRVRRSAAIYDTYSRQTRRLLYRFDESDPRFLSVRDLNSGDPDGWFAFAKDGSAILYKQNGQWHDYLAAVRAQAQTRTQQSSSLAQYNAIVARNKANPELQAQIAQAQGMVAASNARMAGTWTAPNCNASYNGCR